jgi:hypothetical protein
LDQLRNLWQDALQGQLAPMDLVLDLQIVEGTAPKLILTDLWKLRLNDSVMIGFSDGSLTAPYLIVQPRWDTVLFGKSTVSPITIENRYDAVALEILPTPAFQVAGTSQQLGVHRISGGESTLEVTTGGGPGVPLVGRVVTSDLVVTLVAIAPGLKSLPDLRAFDPIYTWIASVLNGQNPSRDAVVTPYSFGKPSPADATLLEDTLPVKINFINPLLINPTTQMAPYAFDLRLHLTPPQQ